MHLWGRRRTALAILFTLALAAFGVGLASLASAGPTPAPTADGGWAITFRTVGAGCSSRPDPPSLTIATGTHLTLINETGVPALLDYGAKKPPTVAAGADWGVRLGAGEHLIRMVPQCVAAGPVDAATVSVERNPASVGPGVGWPDSQSTAPAAPRPGSVVGPVDHPGPTSGRVTAAEPVSSSVGPAADPSPVLRGGPDPNTISMGLPMGAGTDRRGGYLLAVVALICILGVGVGIIRVIRAQRASSAQQRVT